jgi:hypothetical protein
MGCVKKYLPGFPNYLLVYLNFSELFISLQRKSLSPLGLKCELQRIKEHFLILLFKFTSKNTFIIDR